MLNPQQNININISYNLGPDKVTRLPAKKIHKLTKPATPPNPLFDPDPRHRKNTENNHRKSNEFKSLHEHKKTKKKTPLSRNTLTPDIFGERRLKTEGPSTDYDPLSAFKKEKSQSKHHASIQVGMGKKSGKKGQGKMSKVKGLGSCTVPSWKKPSSIECEHSVSQGPRKRRTQSHSQLVKNDKVVSKLLNMSILASELGGSQPITSERRGNGSSHSRQFKEYMSSMDMRILNCLREDVPAFGFREDVPVFAEHHHNVIRNVLLVKRISLEELTRKAILIQRRWRRWREQSKHLVIGQYQRLFKQIAFKFRPKAFSNASSPSSLSGPASLSGASSIGGPSIFENEGVVNSIRKEQYMMQSSEESLSNPRNIRWIQDSSEEVNLNETQQIGLNIPKYRQLVNSQLERKKGKPRQECQQQWNNLNKKIQTALNHRQPIDQQILFQQLIQQSENNQFWIDHEFQDPPREHHPQPEKSEKPDKPEQVLEKEKESLQKQGEDSLQEEDVNEYDHDKYRPLSGEKPAESLTPQECCPLNGNEPASLQAEEGAQSLHLEREKGTHLDREKGTHLDREKGMDQVWISQQMEDNVVRNYLDCGLNDFGIDINSRILNGLPQEEEVHSSYNSSSDEPIGSRFEQANIGLLKEQPEPQLQPSLFGQVLDSCATDRAVEDVVQFLISEFASDISLILKKSTNQAPSQRQTQPRLQGIPTNFNSIKDYLASFIAFILKQETAVSKVLQTINKDIGPSSLEILTYLRPESEDSIVPYNLESSEPSADEDDGLFVVPAEIYEDFENHLEQLYRLEHDKEIGPRLKAYFSFWHRCIFQSFNQCLDFQRPYGVEGKPYEWTTDNKIFRAVRRPGLEGHLWKASQRLLQMTSMVGGIIFERAESPFSGELSEEQRHMMNEERLSRILATELLESEQSWINYNDEMAQLLVELSRMIEEKLFFEHATELKKLQRRRKLVAEESLIEETVSFQLEEL